MKHSKDLRIGVEVKPKFWSRIHSWTRDDKLCVFRRLLEIRKGSFFFFLIFSWNILRWIQILYSKFCISICTVFELSFTVTKMINLKRMNEFVFFLKKRTKSWIMILQQSFDAEIIILMRANYWIHIYYICQSREAFKSDNERKKRQRLAKMINLVWLDKKVAKNRNKQNVNH